MADKSIWRFVVNFFMNVCILYVLYEGLWNFIGISMRYEYRDYIGKILLRSLDLYVVWKDEASISAFNNHACNIHIGIFPQNGIIT